MDAQELRNLQEAYMEVVMNELDEGYKELPVDKMVAKSKSLSRKPKPPGSPRWGPNDEAASRIRKVAGTHSRAKVKKVEKANRERGTQREEYDLYDIILSHLLDEGYAETIESAEAIMVNMSEEWRDDIIEKSGEQPLPYGRMMKKSDELANKGEGKRAAKIYLAANAPKGPKVKVRK